jgi:hypothetical protein
MTGHFAARSAINERKVFRFMTAPMTEVIGIYGLSTDAMQPHSNCLMVSQPNDPSFTLTAYPL